MPATVPSVEMIHHRVPLLVGRQCLVELLVTVSRDATAGGVPSSVRACAVRFGRDGHRRLLSTIEIHHETPRGLRRAFTFSNSDGPETAVTMQPEVTLMPGEHRFTITVDLHDAPNLDVGLTIEQVRVTYGDGQQVALTPERPFTHRPAVLLRSAGQDGSDTYRIPGIVTTNAGTLIAVYDVRYNNDRDLQEDINIGMSRSTDGGHTWEPMRVVLDMGEWGGRDRRRNGVGDPCILHDPSTGTTWVAALWLSGLTPDDRVFLASRPGMEPTETGQILLTKSTDDGLTWSAPVNITPQVKDPRWQLLLQGPGAGIALSDGTLVFPAQFTEDVGVPATNGGRYTPFATIITSGDGGRTWRIGSGAKANTTEAQVVELSDGRLMLNMRDDCNRAERGSGNGRAVAVTSDLGRTWVEHPASNCALPEPCCMASIIGAEVNTGGTRRRALLFSNPDSTHERAHMTIKASLDDGATWPTGFQVELCGPAGYGYSCLTMVDDVTVGIVYEGVKELYFQRVPITHILTSEQRPEE